MAQIRDHEARIPLHPPALVDQGLHLGDHVAGTGPAPGPVGEAVEAPPGLAGEPGHRHLVLERVGDPALEGLVSGNGHHILDLQPIQGPEEPRRGEAGIQPHADPGATEAAPQPGDDPPEQGDRSLDLPRPAGSQPGVEQPRLRVVVDREEAEQRQVAVAVVEAVEEPELLRAVHRVVGAIEVDGDEPGPAVLPAQSADDVVLEGQQGGMQLAAGGGVLEAGQGRLAAEAALGAGAAAAGGLQHRIAPEERGVIAVGVAESAGVDALTEEVEGAVAGAGGIPPVHQAGRQGSSQADPAVQRAEEEAAAVGALEVGVEGDVDRLGGESFEEDGVSGRMGHAGVVGLADGRCFNHPIGRSAHARALSS